LVYGKSESLKNTKKGSLWLPEVLVNNIYFEWKKCATLQLREVLKGWIFKEKRS
jgi:hypothetical protein